MAFLLGKRDGRLNTGRLFYFSARIYNPKRIGDETPMVRQRPMKPGGSTPRQLVVKL
jgi:hypothetical protein